VREFTFTLYSLSCSCVCRRPLVHYEKTHGERWILYNFVQLLCIFKFIYINYFTPITYIHSIYSYMLRVRMSAEHVEVYRMNICNWCVVFGINTLICTVSIFVNKLLRTIFGP
jgi:hypothetical protein